MKLLFILLGLPAESEDGGMYGSLAEQFHMEGHFVSIMAPDIGHTKSYCNYERGMQVVRVGSKQTQGINNMFKKGIALASLPYYFKRAYQKFLSSEKFDWIIMPTPPITLSGFVKYVKNKTGAHFYLILRDIHPQSIWSIGLLHNKLEYKYLDNKARIGYQTADLIGCMSQGNIEFIREQYPSMHMGKLVLLYNWITKPSHNKIDPQIRQRMSLDGKFVALFGGNLGRGQRIENIIYLAEHYSNMTDIVFLIIAKGVEKDRMRNIAKSKKLTNIQFLDFMAQADYLSLIESVDVGLVSINEDYKVPTCPSKAVSYMAAGVPILAMINANNDYGEIIEKSGSGYWAVGSDKIRTIELFNRILTNKELRMQMSENGKLFYEQNCTAKVAYSTMIAQMTSL